MNNHEQYLSIFTKLFKISEQEAKVLKYQDIPAWDSVGHMGLIAAIEDTFGIMLEADDIVDFSSYENGIKILKKYGVEI